MDMDMDIYRADLEKLGQEWATGELRGDTAHLERLLTNDFVGIGPRGFMLTKDQWLARYVPDGLRYDSFTWVDVQVRVYGDAAIATGRQSQTGTYQGHDVQGAFRGTQVFVRQNERWLLAGMHLSPIAGGA